MKSFQKIYGLEHHTVEINGDGQTDGQTSDYSATQSMDNVSFAINKICETLPLKQWFTALAKAG